MGDLVQGPMEMKLIGELRHVPLVVCSPLVSQLTVALMKNMLLINLLFFAAHHSFSATRFQYSECDEASEQREEPQH